MITITARTRMDRTASSAERTQTTARSGSAAAMVTPYVGWIGLANEIGKICQSAEVDSHKVMDIFVQDRKLNLSPYYLKPGFAFGGSCLPKDVRAITGLAHANGVEVPLIDSLLRSNDSHIDHAFRLIAETGAKQVGLLGVTFKDGTDDLRESPQIDLLGRLIDAGYKVLAFVLSAMVTGLAGALLAHHVRFLTPEGFGLILSLVGVPLVLPIAAGLAFIAAFLNSVFGYCLGCEMYLLGARLRHR